MSDSIRRRDALKTGALAGLAFWAGTSRARAQQQKLRVACIGCGGKGESNVHEMSGEQIVGLCDVDDKRAGNVFGRYPDVPKFKDYRVMLEQLKNVDAVVVSTPDHMHGPAAMLALSMGKHVYCEKPLTRTPWEARRLRELAKEKQVVTQMGNQGTSHGGLRKAVEVIQAGAVGAIKEVHVWTNRPIWPQGIDRPAEVNDIPGSLDWKLWLGVAPERPFNRCYLPFNWRGWWDYGTGALGDMACHTANMAFMALKLGLPTAVEPVELPTDKHAETAPKWSVMRYEFPQRGDLPPVTLYWYEGGRKPPAALTEGLSKPPSSGSLLLGDKGKVYSPNDYGSYYELHPQEQFKEYEPPAESLPRAAKGHYKEFIQACKGEGATMSNFDYAATFTEAMVLGCISQRLVGKIEYDAATGRVTNNPEAETLVKPTYPTGYTV
ncbi:MAG: Gfo/Idh/MocA family oxidoreductase [Fimbriimonadaceae bacterium]|nr:Gfo/Idh/MocA family oxidoreductase [Fimbriimonadaceae bacterium]